MKRSILLFFPSLIIIVIVIVLSRLKYFQIQKVDCKLDNYPCPLELEPFLVKLHQQNIFKLSKKNLSSQLEHFDSNYTDIKIQKKPPSNLFISIKKRTPVAIVNSVINLYFDSLNSTASASLSGQLTDKFFHLDKSGQLYLLDQKPNQNLPRILVDQTKLVKPVEHKLTRTLADLIHILNSYYLKFEILAWLPGNQIIIKINLGPYVVINSDQALNSAIASLQYILTNIKIDQHLPTKIDLRFDKPVLTY